MNSEAPKFIQEFDKVLAISGAIVSIILIIYLNLKIGRFIYLLTGILSFLSFVGWLIIRKKASLNFPSVDSSVLPKLLISLFFIVFTLDIISLYIRPDLYQRPLIHFFLVSILVGITVLEITTGSRNRQIYDFLIFFQIILVGILVTWSQLLVFPSLIGVDPWYHQNFTSELLSKHFVPEHELYSKLPLYHILVACTSAISELDYKFATMFSASLAHIICISSFVFLFAKRLFQNNYKVAYLASLLLVISNNYIYMSYTSLPNSFAMIFVFPIFYCMLFLKEKRPLTAASLSIFLSLVLVLSHTITSFFMCIILFVFWVGSLIYYYMYKEKNDFIGINFFILFATFMFGWWTFVSGHINSLASLIKWGFNADYFSTIPKDISLETLSKISILEQFFDNIGMFSFFSLSFMGCLYMVSRKYGNSLKFRIALIAITPLIIGFFSLIFGKFVIVQRWWYFSQVTLVIPLSVSLLVLFNIIKNNNVKHLCTAGFTIVLAFFLITNSLSNIDNHILSPKSSITFSFTSSELQAIKTGSYIWDGTIKTDWYYAYTQKYYFNTEPFDTEMYEDNFSVLKGSSLILVREYILKNPFSLRNSIKLLDYDLNMKLEKLRFSNVYDNGLVEGYI